MRCETPKVKQEAFYISELELNRIQQPRWPSDDRRRDNLGALILFALLAFGCWLALPVGVEAETCPDVTSPASPTIVKVGVTAYEQIERTYAKYITFLASLNMIYCQKPVAFQVAVGNYAEVLDWWKNGEIEVGILAAGPVIRLRQTAADAVEANYIGSVDDPEIRDPGGNTIVAVPDYHSMAVVHNSGLAANVSSLLEARATANANHVPLRFLFIRPDSTSGYLVPRALLQQQSIPIEDKRFTYSADGSLDELGRDDNTKAITIAFMYENEQLRPKWNREYKTLKEPDLAKTSIPIESILINNNLKQTTQRDLIKLFQQLKNKSTSTKPLLFFVDANWPDRFHHIESEVSDFSVPEPRIPFTEIVNDLIQSSHCRDINHEWTCSAPPRLALVLSGGGAKCAYQAGAISAIESYLDKERHNCASATESERCAALSVIDINLITGTSGGSINALMVALGATKSGQGRLNLEKLWEGLEQNTIITFPWLLRITAATFLDAILGYIVLSIIDRRASVIRPRVIILYLVVCLFALAYGFLWRWHPRPLPHILEHGAMILASTSRDGGLAGAAVAVISVTVAATYLSRVPRERLKRMIGLSCVVMFGGSILTSLIVVPALIRSETIAVAVADGVAQYLEQGTCEAESEEGRSVCISKKIMSTGAIRRDLVITASRLPPEAMSIGEQGGDVYFMAHGQPPLGAIPAEGDTRFVDIGRPANAGKLLSAVVASSTIYPFFAAKTISLATPPNYNETPEEQFTLVDGGFIHDSPVEAALRWKADRIVLIEASPPDRLFRSTNFVESLSNSFAFLFFQAQRVDTSSRGQVEIYELRPACIRPDAFGNCQAGDEWSMDLFDFTKERLRSAVELGESDVTGPTPRFLRLTGPPPFRDVATLR